MTRVSLLLLVVAASCGAADPPRGKVRLPSAPPVPAPMPPAPDAPIVLTPDLVLVCDADDEQVVIVSPPGRLKVTAEKGPVRARGKFADGTGQVETRVFAGPFVYFIEAVEPGECELLVLPVGGREGDLLRRRVVSQTAPQPPPKPPEPRPPEPKPPDTFRVIWVVESGTTPPPGQVAVTDSAVVRDWLNANCTKEANHPGWRKFDPQQKTDGEQPVMRALWEAVKPKLTTLPCVAIERDGKVVIEPFPANPEAALVLFKKYKAGG